MARHAKSAPSASLPAVAVNFAITADGKISTRNFTPANFSSKSDKHRLLEIRASGDALLVGLNTVKNDNMTMGLPDAALRDTRVRRGKPAWPLRVIVTNSGRIDPTLRVFQRDFSPVAVYSTARMPKSVQSALAGKAELHLHPGKTVNLEKMLLHLREYYKVKRVVCEGGPSLFRSMLSGGFVNEINLTLCPPIFGGAKAPTLTGLPGEFLPRTVACKLAKMEVSGSECFLRYLVLR